MQPLVKERLQWVAAGYSEWNAATTTCLYCIRLRKGRYILNKFLTVEEPGEVLGIYTDLVSAKRDAEHHYSLSLKKASTMQKRITVSISKVFDINKMVEQNPDLIPEALSAIDLDPDSEDNDDIKQALEAMIEDDMMSLIDLDASDFKVEVIDLPGATEQEPAQESPDNDGHVEQ